MGAQRFIAVVGYRPDLEREDGAANILRGLGAVVRTLGFWEQPWPIVPRNDGGECETVRALVIEGWDRPDLAVGVLRELRQYKALDGCGAIAAVSTAHVAQLEPASGFDDFVLVPYVPAELYARIRQLEWRRSEFATEERIKIGSVVIDRLGREVAVDGTVVRLTAREFALLIYLCSHRGRVVSRAEALARVWGSGYEGGPRTVDIHIRRLRHKLGHALPLETLRGAGYKVATPDRGEADCSSEPSAPSEKSSATDPQRSGDVALARPERADHTALGER